MDNQNSNNTSIIYLILALICIAIAVSLFQKESLQNKEYDAKKEVFFKEDTVSTISQNEAPKENIRQEEDADLPDASDNDKQTLPTKDVLESAGSSGWVSIETIVSEPIMQAEDNEYYLTHSYDGSNSRYGSAFLDYRCSLQDPYLLIYGHNVKGGRMFGGLKQLRDKDKCQRIDAKLCFAPDYEYKSYHICLVAIVQETNEIFALLDIPAQLKANALFEINEIDEEKQTVLLSTCYGQAGTDKRIVVALQEE